MLFVVNKLIVCQVKNTTPISYYVYIGRGNANLHERRYEHSSIGSIATNLERFVIESDTMCLWCITEQDVKANLLHVHVHI